MFRVYQFLIYAIWLWYAYIFVGALLFVIVLVAAGITIVNRRRGQYAIAKVPLLTFFQPIQPFLMIKSYNVLVLEVTICTCLVMRRLGHLPSICTPEMSLVLHGHCFQSLQFHLLDSHI